MLSDSAKRLALPQPTRQHSTLRRTTCTSSCTALDRAFHADRITIEPGLHGRRRAGGDGRPRQSSDQRSGATRSRAADAQLDDRRRLRHRHGAALDEAEVAHREWRAARAAGADSLGEPPGDADSPAVQSTASDMSSERAAATLRSGLVRIEQSLDRARQSHAALVRQADRTGNAALASALRERAKGRLTELKTAFTQYRQARLNEIDPAEPEATSSAAESGARASAAGSQPIAGCGRASGCRSAAARAAGETARRAGIHRRGPGDRTLPLRRRSAECPVDAPGTGVGPGPGDLDEPLDRSPDRIAPGRRGAPGTRTPRRPDRHSPRRRIGHPGPDVRPHGRRPCGHHGLESLSRQHSGFAQRNDLRDRPTVADSQREPRGPGQPGFHGRRAVRQTPARAARRRARWDGPRVAARPTDGEPARGRWLQRAGPGHDRGAPRRGPVVDRLRRQRGQHCRASAGRSAGCRPRWRRKRCCCEKSIIG